MMKMKFHTEIKFHITQKLIFEISEYLKTYTLFKNRRSHQLQRLPFFHIFNRSFNTHYRLIHFNKTTNSLAPIYYSPFTYTDGFEKRGKKHGKMFALKQRSTLSANGRLYESADLVCV